MTENVTKLEYQGKELILVATAHISEASVELVKETIETERPDSVCIELDEGRYKTIQDPKAWERTDISQIIKDKKVGLMLAQVIISAYQKRMAKKLGTKVGGEMIQGIESANEVGAEIILADRNIQTTFTRLWRLLTLKEKMKLIVGLVLGDDEDDDELTEADILAMLEKDMLESILGEVRDEFPIIGQVLISERDQFLANKIKNAPGEKVLAVLGGAHVPGVMEEIYKEQDIEAINTVPHKKSRAKYLALIIPLGMIGLIIYGFTRGFDVGMQNLTSWWLWNGGLAALFASFALTHPLGIIAAFISAPLTTLVPFVLTAGLFAGLVQAWLKKPTVQDMQNIPDDVFRFKGYYQNRFLKILIIFFLTNIGSTIGTFIAGADIIRNLFGG